MSDKLFLVTPIFPPSVNHYLGYRAVCKGGKGIVIAYTTKEAEKFKEEFRKYAAEEVKKQGWKIENTKDRHHYMDCVFYFPRKDMDEQNYYKVMSDALNGIAYIDDKNILTRTHRIYYDSENPRIEITIHKTDYIGIFDTEEQMQQFEEKCKTCRRYKNNCSILKKAKEGRIQKEIDENLNCKEYKKKKE